MANSNMQKLLSLIFLPAVLLALLLAGSSTLFHLAQNILIVQLQNVSHIPALKTLTIFPQIIFVIALLIFAKYKPFETVFRSTLVAFIGIISLLTGLTVFQESLQLNGLSVIPENFFPSHIIQIYEPVIKNWPVSLLYIALNLLSFNLFSLLIWGFINRLTTLSDGIKYYIPFVFLLGLAGALLTNVQLLLPTVSDWPVMSMVIPATALLIFALIIFNWSWKRLPDDFIHPEETQPVSRNRFPFLAGAYLLAGSLMVEQILSLLFKYQIKSQFSDPSAYSEFMSYYSISVGAATIITSIFWMALGTWLIIKKGWGTTALFGSMSILIGGLAFIGFSYVNQSISWLSQGIFTGLSKGTTAALFFPLIQIAYLYMPYRARFRTKILTEMIALPLMKSIPLLMVQALIIIYGSMSAIIMYLNILIPILLVLLVLLVTASRTIGSRLTGGFGVNRGLLFRECV